jgi:hypothetical protein
LMNHTNTQHKTMVLPFAQKNLPCSLQQTTSNVPIVFRTGMRWSTAMRTKQPRRTTRLQFLSYNLSTDSGIGLARPSPAATASEGQASASDRSAGLSVLVGLSKMSELLMSPPTR